ncbi:MAG: chromate efflux transporter [Pseudomonadota bacterium]|jgi:chromate transporter|uniref:chromate efflux transporter n=1 Tax=Methylophaga thalassica TaxID=40223 RepID=UPI000C397BF7|nr:chromate efflux transporter [Methylophaga thalassica]MAX50611.1 chromate transporter [Methylophaga sp.]MEC9412170.1 chromate efflux transporter [Pseudomonadota bacterium]WVI84009.1 chromate efflux transporter [Methylophaga thalassica]|tara:strand:- start:427 stop:1872 length:1446 start_codon:yes stop_codon:yes gene_type:complete
MQEPSSAPDLVDQKTKETTASNINKFGHHISFREAVHVWLRIAMLSFGGPAGQIAVMHRILVDEKRWVSENRFLHALNYCMVLPGPEAQQLATYIGWLLHGVRGGLVAGGLFILPGFLSILVLSVLYAGFQDATWVQALFFGIKAAVLAIVIQAVIRIGKRALKNAYMYTLASTAFIAIFFFAVPFPIVILTAAFIGLLGRYIDPERFTIIKGHDAPEEADRAIDNMIDSGQANHTKATRNRAFKVLAVWLPLWFAPLIVLLMTLGYDDVFTQIGLFFSKLAVVTFGGAYSVLAYMAQEAVQNYGWLSPGEMLDGLGMAETTPGPLIQVVQFVGFMGAFRDAGLLDPITAGILASLLATWVTFVPCFLWIFLGAPYVETLRGNKAVSAALSAVTAAVVGVMLNLAIWFAVHVAFDEVNTVQTFGIQWLLPTWNTIQISSIVLALGAFIAMLRFKVGMLPVIFVTALLGIIYYLLFGGAPAP